MTTVTRADLAEAAYPYGLVEKNEAGDLVNQCLATISDTLVAGEKVGINGFGAFTVRQKRARIGRNQQSFSFACDAFPHIVNANNFRLRLCDADPADT
jgi:integration host factor subunit alpha